MKKDIIYIDTEDDITSIIEKVKSATEKIIALVPPKRVGVLQSAVNLKLLQKAATNSGKRLVIITHSVPLASLAAGVQIPVAKTLQSRPEIAATEVPVDDDDDIIRGDELPVGDHQKSVQAVSQGEDEEVILPDDLDIVDDPSPAKPTKKVKKPSSGIPNFDDFRKKIIFIGGGVILLIIFLIWAIVFAPHATVNIQAKTDAHAVDLPATLKTDGTGNPKSDTIPAQSQQIKKTASAEFTATGKKEIGNKATGTMELTRTSISNNTLTIPAGTGFSNGNFTFVSTEETSLQPTTVGNGGLVQDTSTVRVQAAAVGEDYNLAARSYQPTMSGFTADGSAMTGGSKQQVTIISDADIEQAKQKLVVGDQSAIRNELAAKFNDKTIVVKESYTSAQGAPAVAPAVGEQASKGQITVETTYTLLAVNKSDLDLILNRVAKEHVKGQENQRVYDNGRSGLRFTKYNPADLSLHLVATSYTGPKINVDSLKSQLVGKNYEEVRQIIQAIDGVKDVDTKFSPFWVSKIPGDEKKTDIVFKVSQDGSSN